MDEHEFRSATYQRVYQYIRRHTAGHNLDTYAYNGTVEGTAEDCIKVLLRYNPIAFEVNFTSS